MLTARLKGENIGSSKDEVVEYNRGMNAFRDGRSDMHDCCFATCGHGKYRYLHGRSCSKCRPVMRAAFVAGWYDARTLQEAGMLRPRSTERPAESQEERESKHGRI